MQTILQHKIQLIKDGSLLADYSLEDKRFELDGFANWKTWLERAKGDSRRDPDAPAHTALQHSAWKECWAAANHSPLRASPAHGNYRCSRLGTTVRQVRRQISEQLCRAIDVVESFAPIVF
ncbi:MAG: hypothetical protein NNA18_01915 [Nitrospira sp.]|nr:hypothetical protein [Nitrospira sp.]